MAVITKSVFARKQKISAGRVSQYIKTQILKDCLLPDGRLDENIAKIELAKNIDGAKRIDYQVRVALDPKMKPVEEYVVAKPFVEKIGGEEFLVLPETIMRVYSDKGRVEIAFFPGRKEVQAHEVGRIKTKRKGGKGGTRTDHL